MSPQRLSISFHVTVECLMALRFLQKWDDSLSVFSMLSLIQAI